MKKDILKQWIVELEKFSKGPSYLQLRFPMRVETTQGTAYSPTGILCNIHSDKTKTKWTEDRTDDKRIPSYVMYLNGHDVPPKEVTDWFEVTGSFWSQIHTENNNGFLAVIKFLQKYL